MFNGDIFHLNYSILLTLAIRMNDQKRPYYLIKNYE